MSETILSEEQDVEQSQQAVPLFTRPSLRIVSRPVSKSTTTAEFNLNKSFNTSSESKKRQFKVPSRSASTASSSTSSTMIVSPLAVRQSSAAPLDFSFQDFESLSDVVPDQDRSSSPKPTTPSTTTVALPRLRTAEPTVLRLGNNKFTDLSDLIPTLSRLSALPQTLVWLDLSFNAITDLPHSLSSLSSLVVLYLHANKISSLSQTDVFIPLVRLRNLTLHGNPVVEEGRGYRLGVVGRVPGLKHLDFSPVTKADRTLCRKIKANCWVKRENVETE